MRVWQINSVCGYGSTGRIAVDIYNTLEEYGHESLITYGRGSSVEGINCLRIGTDFDNYIHVANNRLFDNHGFSSTAATKKIIKKIKEYNPDVIHLHNIHGYYVNVEILSEYLKEANKPIIWTMHDCWPFTGHCAYFDYITCDKWKTGCSSCPQKNMYPKSILKDNSKYNYEKKKELFTGIKDLTIVTPSKWLAELVKESYLKEYDVKVINNGIDLNIFKPTQSTFRERYLIKDKFIVLGVANVWEERKGLKYFIELSKNIDDDCKIVLVGLNDAQISQLPKNIIGIERTNSIEELAEIYTAADVFVNPTLEEVFGLTNIESLACGTPVITFDTGGSIEAIDDSCGVIVKKGSFSGLKLEIEKLMLKNFSSIQCINKSKYYDKNNVYQEYMHLYSGVIR